MRVDGCRNNHYRVTSILNVQTIHFAKNVDNLFEMLT